MHSPVHVTPVADDGTQSAQSRSSTERTSSGVRVVLSPQNANMSGKQPVSKMGVNDKDVDMSDGDEWESTTHIDGVPIDLVPLGDNATNNEDAKNPSNRVVLVGKVSYVVPWVEICSTFFLFQARYI